MVEMNHARDFAVYCAQRQIAEDLAVLLSAAPREISVPICVAVLDAYAPVMPIAETAFSDLRGDAGFWAAVAGPHELREVVAAGCRVLSESGAGQAMAIGPRKRLMLDLWNSMPEADKRKFLARVDPKGVFRGAS